MLSALVPPQSIPKWFHSRLPRLAWRDCGNANTGELIMWQVHPSSSIAKPGFAATSAACVFPRYSTRLFKETLAVTGLVFLREPGSHEPLPTEPCIGTIDP